MIAQEAPGEPRMSLGVTSWSCRTLGTLWTRFRAMSGVGIGGGRWWRRPRSLCSRWGCWRSSRAGTSTAGKRTRSRPHQRQQHHQCPLIRLTPRLRAGLRRPPGHRHRPSHQMRQPSLPQLSTASDVEASAGVLETPGFEDVRGWIAFRSGEDLVAVDPANPANRVSFGSSGGADPIGWSADGTRLLLRPHPEQVAEFFDGGWGIGTSATTSPLDFYVLSSDGSRTRLTRSGNGATWGSFSPDGTNVVFACCGSEPGPYIVDADGEQSRLLGDPRPSGEPLSEWAAWSPDGSRIAFVDFWEDHPTYGHHAFTLSFLDPNTGDTLGDVTNVAAAGLAWSPDSSKLAFWAVVPDEDADPAERDLGAGWRLPRPDLRHQRRRFGAAPAHARRRQSVAHLVPGRIAHRLRARSVDAQDGSRRVPSRLRAARHPTAVHHGFGRDRCPADGGSQSRRSDRLEPGSVTHLGGPINSRFEAIVHSAETLGGTTALGAPPQWRQRV